MPKLSAEQIDRAESCNGTSSLGTARFRAIRSRTLYRVSIGRLGDEMLNETLSATAACPAVLEAWRAQLQRRLRRTCLLFEAFGINVTSLKKTRPNLNRLNPRPNFLLVPKFPGTQSEHLRSILMGQMFNWVRLFNFLLFSTASRLTFSSLSPIMRSAV